MFKHMITSIVLIATVVVSIAGNVTPVYAASQVGFDVDNMKFRGEIESGTQLQCVNKAYTPVIDGAGQLRMIAWGLVQDGLVDLPENGADWVGSSVQEVETTKLRGCNFLVTATRGANDVAKLTAWFSGAGGFERLFDTGDTGMAATEMAMTSIGYPNDPLDQDPGAGIVVLASRSNDGRLIMSSWSVIASDLDELGAPEPGFHLNHLEVSELGSNIEIIAMDLPNVGPDFGVYIGHVVTAMKTPQGNLKLISWGIDGLGSFHRLADSGDQAGAVDGIAMTRYEEDRLVTAVKNSQGKLQMIAWHFDSQGDILRYQGLNDPAFHNPYGPEVEAIDIADNFVDVAGLYDVVTAARTKTGQLLLISWAIDTTGSIVQLGDMSVLSGLEGPVNIGWTPESNKLVTSVRYVDGSLLVIAWRSFKTSAMIVSPDIQDTKPGDIKNDDGQDDPEETKILDIKIPETKPQWPVLTETDGQEDEQMLLLPFTVR